eukprot:TRINITY_DN386_c0_g1_i1.p2 TRINITY_DN386_c0_g1~~TRINITY_DN386_c0_g1_i1.p2  ORF type:complete len:147 (-),score=34.48 TRINITY_DN386_c0_g1_i1:103-543(-)
MGGFLSRDDDDCHRRDSCNSYPGNNSCSPPPCQIKKNDCCDSSYQGNTNSITFHLRPQQRQNYHTQQNYQYPPQQNQNYYQYPQQQRQNYPQHNYIPQQNQNYYQYPQQQPPQNYPQHNYVVQQHPNFQMTNNIENKPPAFNPEFN